MTNHSVVDTNIAFSRRQILQFSATLLGPGILAFLRTPTWRWSSIPIEAGSYRLKVHRTGFRANDAYSAYIDMGAPRELTPIQLDRLNLLTRDLPEIDRVVRVGKKGSYAFSLPMHSNDVVLVTLEKVKK